MVIPKLQKIENLLQGRIDWESYWEYLQKNAPKTLNEVKECEKFLESKRSSLRKVFPDYARFLHGNRKASLYLEKKLIEILKTEKSPSVIAAIGNANIDIKSSKLANEMLKFAGHTNIQVKLSVIRSNDFRTNNAFLAVLKKNLSDPSSSIRSWSLFTLGNTFENSKLLGKKELKRIAGHMKLDKSKIVTSEAYQLLKELDIK